MKPILLLIAISTSISATAQWETFAGNYNHRYDLEDGGVIEYKLSLNPDGTFFFHNYRKLTCALCSEENQYGNGSWTAKNNEIYFSTNRESDLDEKHTLDFSGTKARSNKRSPRNKSSKVVKESIRFYTSEIPWLKGWELFRN
jgi:hypothetical protein